MYKSYFKYLKSIYGGTSFKKILIFSSVMFVIIAPAVVFAAGMVTNSVFLAVLAPLFGIFISVPWAKYGINWLVDLDMGYRK